MGYIASRAAGIIWEQIKVINKMENGEGDGQGSQEDVGE